MRLTLTILHAIVVVAAAFLGGLTVYAIYLIAASIAALDLYTG